MNESASHRASAAVVASAALLLLAFFPPFLHAQGSAVDSPASEITLDGFVSAAWSYNFNRPTTTKNGFRIFDFDDNRPKIDVIEMVLQRAPTRVNDGGFRLDVELGAAIPRVTVSSGSFRSSHDPQNFDLQQAYLSYVAPIGSGLRIDVGKFVTPVGYELIEGYDGFNDNATRSFLFGYAIPFAHTGLRLGYAIGPRVGVTAIAVNGWDVVNDNNGAKTLGVQLTYTPADGVLLLAGFVVGAERSENSSDQRKLFDLVAVWKVGDRLTLGANVDYGAETFPAGSAVWRGLAGYAKVAVSDPFTIAVRGELFEDRDGARTGVAQTLKEITLTPEYRLSLQIVARADLRVDYSSEDVFEENGVAVDSQPTVLLNLIWMF